MDAGRGSGKLALCGKVKSPTGAGIALLGVAHGLGSAEEPEPQPELRVLVDGGQQKLDELCTLPEAAPDEQVTVFSAVEAPAVVAVGDGDSGHNGDATDNE